MRKSVIAILIGIVVVAGVVIALVMRNQERATNTDTGNTNTVTLNSNASAETVTSDMANSNSVSDTNASSVSANTNSVTNSAATNTSTTTAQFVDYTVAALASAQQRGRTVLYFHANWCPVCKALEPDLRTNISTFPADVTILKVDYDQETALKQQYGVTYQHTFVQVDAADKELKQWSGGDAQAASVRSSIL